MTNDTVPVTTGKTAESAAGAANSIALTSAVIPTLGRAGSRKKYKATDKGKAANKRYAQSPLGKERMRRDSEREYLSRPFLAWDGEGVAVDNRYVLLANSVGGELRDRDGLSTREIFDFLLETKRANPKAIHIIYGGGYDFNFWLRSLGRDDVLRVYRHEAASRQAGVRVGKYRVWWRRGKYFRVASGKLSITVYDVLPFFQRKFATACDEYLGDGCDACTQHIPGCDSWEDRDEIYAQKARRSTFTLDELDDIAHYNRAELRNLVRLATELRERLNRVGLRPGRWDGPGAIAAALMTQKGIRDAQSRGNANKTPAAVAKGIRCAYAGGRFELVRFGDVDAPAYEYDINSAYPHALRRVPCLAHGRWIHHDSDPGWREFALYHVRYSGPQSWQPAPLFRRIHNGAIVYPGAVENWYWTPEIDVTREYVQRTPGARLDVIECWEWLPNPAGCAAAGHEPLPFAWIDGYYLKRQALKKGGDGAHVGIKLALNSLYGKLAQQVGWYRDENGTLRIPPFHELAWAGYVTSTCRSMVFRATMDDSDSVIAYETDAVFTNRPLTVDIGNGLGQWEETAFSSLAYCQSGTYFATTEDGKEIVRTRGVDLGTLRRDDFREAIQAGAAAERVMAAQLTRFIGAGLALAQDWGKWCTWQTEPKRITAEPPDGSKRQHDWCPACDAHGAYAVGVWHRTMCEYPSREGSWVSEEFPIEWENPNPDMALAELREGNYEAYDGME